MGGTGIFAVDSLSGTYALVVDPEKERRVLLSGILRYCGALVTPVDSSEAALAVMAQLRPDVLVVDFTEPDACGLPLIRSVRALKPDAGGTVPSIAVGDGGDNATLARARGFDGYLTRPLEAWAFCRLVQSLLPV
jgi:CheY-like chemotaxis protein